MFWKHAPQVAGDKFMDPTGALAGVVPMADPVMALGRSSMRRAAVRLTLFMARRKIAKFLFLVQLALVELVSLIGLVVDGVIRESGLKAHTSRRAWTM